MAFGSFDSKGTSHTVSEINMVPLIDVMLVLLVIFIITAPLLSHSIKIDIPQASAEQVKEQPKAIDLAIDAQGKLFWNEQPVAMEQLAPRFAGEARLDPQPRLQIRADLNTRYEVLAQIMGYARGAGIKHLGFMTRPDPVPAK
ncbi:biopolymer transporter ExbD [Paralcaligenes sp. KSB-10]|uniref:ExbD/TolR family protein n=1 Tax=Paralcaligenes sp. KSB-10 TaxID=2901142 RepID=UPI001E3C4F70|nr:biopolymer transporter ExbD [Paralcaligenes sp. KSB-10]UHL64464.1 biopolymer transporter ExbD [Paralcaligenes sp. KSB-10]